MIGIEDLYRALKTFRFPPDDEQRQTIEVAADQALFIVAGPGSGKTTCLTLRVLKMVLVERIPPKGILATTFTVKAAQELRSRILGWGFKIIDALKADPKTSKVDRQWLEDVDINQVWTGTLDSLCEQLLRDYRAPGTQPPVLADEYVSKTLMLRHGLLSERRDQNQALDMHLLSLHSDSGNRFGFHIGTKVGLMKSIWDRRHMDQVNWANFVKAGPKDESAGRQVLNEGISDYANELARRGLVDFSLLENEVLVRLQKGQLSDFTQDIKVLLVDEYQDSNLLQENIYFELAKACHGALCVVGDDDQSLYRFRGATVDLFSNFVERYQERFKRKPTKLYLSSNYRSTQRIVSLINDYAALDKGYQTVRVKGKPKLSHGPSAKQGHPILGMFRDTREQLAEALAMFVWEVFRGKGYSAPGIEKILRDPKNGDVGDCALLSSSPAEYSASNEKRLPRLLREQLERKNPAINVFNPRGQDLTGLDVVARFGGLLAECLDPGAVVQAKTSGLGQETIATLDTWRQVAIDFVGSKAAPKGIEDYALGWIERDPGRSGYEWPRSVSVIDLIYGLVHFLPELHNDSEGQVYLEVFTRQLGACEQVGKFKGRLVYDPSNSGLSGASIQELLRDFLGPVASGTIQVDEDLIEAFPRNQLSILSIHQAKGLEFPITIVDVGSDFKRSHSAHAFKRHPNAGGTPHRMEDQFRTHSPLGKETRSQIDRAFDDLFRHYFVAFSRPQDVLLMIGLSGCLPGRSIPNVATGWDRNGVCQWRSKLPFIEI